MNEPVPIQKVTFYDDQVRSWKDPDGRVFVVLRDPFMALGLNPTQQIERLKSNPLYEGYLQCSDIRVLVGSGVERTFEMDGIDIEMLPMCLAQLNLNQINETHRPKLLRYQRECAKVLRDHWKTRDTVDRYLMAGGWRPYAPEYSLEFMQTVCRLYGAPLPQTKYPCPCVVSTFIHRYIRSVLPSPVQAELRVVNPRNARGNRLRKDHQHFTEETLSKVERERIKFCHGLANSVEDIETFTRLLAAHDERAGVIYTDTQRYGQVISLQGAFPFMLGAQSA
jgi:hypothetical protein